MAFKVGDRVRFKQGVSAGANYRGLIGTITGTPVTGMTDERIDVQFGDDKIADISAQVFELAEPEGAPARYWQPLVILPAARRDVRGGVVRYLKRAASPLPKRPDIGSRRLLLNVVTAACCRKPDVEPARSLLAVSVCLAGC